MQSSTFILICIEPSAFFFGMNVFLFNFQRYASAFGRRRMNSVAAVALNTVFSIRAFFQLASISIPPRAQSPLKLPFLHYSGRQDNNSMQLS